MPKDNDNTIFLKILQGNQKDGQIDIDKFREEIKSLYANLPALIEYFGYQAKLHKAKYDALVSEGFTKQEALELCKNLF